MVWFGLCGPPPRETALRRTPKISLFFSRGFTRQPERAQTCTFEGPGASNTTKIPREDPQRGRKRTKMGAGEGKTSAKFWAPTLWAPALWAPTLWAPTLWAPTLWAPALWAPALWAPTLWAPTLCAPTLCAPTLCAPTLRGSTPSGADPSGPRGRSLGPGGRFDGGQVDSTLQTTPPSQGHCYWKGLWRNNSWKNSKLSSAHCRPGLVLIDRRRPQSHSPLCRWEGACDHVLRSAMLGRLASMPGARSSLPFVRMHITFELPVV